MTPETTLTYQNLIFLVSISLLSTSLLLGQKCETKKDGSGKKGQFEVVILGKL